MHDADPATGPRPSGRAAHGADHWLGWLLVACALGCAAAAGNWSSIWQGLSGTGSLALADDARERAESWLFWGAVAAAGAATVWLVGRALRDQGPRDATSGPPATVHERQRPTAPRPVVRLDRVRWVVAVGWVAVLATAFLAGSRPASYPHLLEEVGAGRVAVVTVAGTPGPGQSEVVQQVTWREGWSDRRAEVVWSQVSRAADGGPTVLRTDVGQVLTDVAPELVVERTDRAEAVSATFLRRYLPAPRVFTAVLLVGALLVLLLIVNSPPPWRLTRWAWFWLGLTPVGVIAFALLAGPTPGLPAPRHPHRRLGGLAAFVLSLVLAPLLHGGSR